VGEGSHEEVGGCQDEGEEEEYDWVKMGIEALLSWGWKLDAKSGCIGQEKLPYITRPASRYGCRAQDMLVTNTP
jgi:hypothetical protein